MKNPLRKRLLRELREEMGKYLVIFLFMTATVGFVSGFLVAGGSMITAYNDSFETYKIEDGHFVLDQPADQVLLKALEGADVTIYPDFYLEADTDSNKDGEADSKLRIYVNRTEMNLVCLMEGSLPGSDQEIAIDRMYADNNGIRVGDRILAGGRELTVSGLVALSDYSALFSDNTDMMFDAVKFGVSVMTEEGFAATDNSNLHYNYCWKYNNMPADEAEEQEQSQKLLKVFGAQMMLYKLFGKQLTIRSYVPRYANQAIQFTGDDMGSDKSMMLVLLYILVVILAFVFSVTINHTVVKESTVIGTLRASGYTKGELLRHYLTNPMLVTLTSALAGNILGYTLFKNIVVSMYYNSYSLPTYVTIWNAEAFVLTTVIPVLLMLVITCISLSRKLSLSPLRFLRRDLAGKQRKKAVRLPSWKFFSRFRLRIIIQNRTGYATMLIGIIFANILLLFGMMMSPLLKRYQKEIVEHMLSDYQYVLKEPVELDAPEAEKYSITSLKMPGENGEAVNVYGIADESAYIKQEIPDEGACISKGFSEKYGIQMGDILTLKDPYGDMEYSFEVKSLIEYPAALAVLISNEEFCRVFDMDADYFNGYFSNEELKGIPELSLVTCISEDDLTKTSRQLTVSMGKMFYMIHAFAVVLFILLIYLLTKLIIDKNTNAISMVKILGYKNGEIARLYLLATTWVVVFSILISFAVATFVIEHLYRAMMIDYSGWLTFYIKPSIYPEMFIMGMASYLAVAYLQMRKIRRIPMEEALKNVE